MPSGYEKDPRLEMILRGWAPVPYYFGRQQAPLSDHGPGDPVQLIDDTAGFHGIYAVARKQGDDDATSTDKITDGLQTWYGAAELARRAGFPAGSVIFLDIESDTAGAPLLPQTIAYIQAWTQAIEKKTVYKPGIYCDAYVARDIKDSVKGLGPGGKDIELRFWVYLFKDPEDLEGAPTADRSPADNGAFPEADIWHYGSARPVGAPCKLRQSRGQWKLRSPPIFASR